MDKTKRGLPLSILGILGLIVITIGVTYAFFHYTKEGTTENSITSGTITFLYTEVSEVGRGISIQDAYPMSDEIGKVQVGEGKVFDFKITSNTSSSTSIPYEITARKRNTSTLDENVVKLYLTEVDGNLEEEVLLENYSNLVQTTKVDRNKYIEKTIYEGTVPANSVNYERNFRLRMWIDESTDFSPVKGENGEDIYPYNGKEFTLTVNVYANGKVVTEEDSIIESIPIFTKTYPVVSTIPTLTTTSKLANENGLYKSTDTNDGRPTYYFRGNVENNYVSFAGYIWRIIRINEDGTIRLIMQDGIYNQDYQFNYKSTNVNNMYYTNSLVKDLLETWYNENLIEYDSKIVNGDYFCEQAKVKGVSDYTSGSLEMLLYNEYIPNFKCEMDAHGYGIINSKIALLSYDEVVFAGGYLEKENTNYYLYNGHSFWTMSPAGVENSSVVVWRVLFGLGGLRATSWVSDEFRVRPVINLKIDTMAIGTGTSTDPYVVQ